MTFDKCKRLIKAIPGVKHWLKRRYDIQFERSVPLKMHRGVFSSFADAVASAPSTKPVGCDSQAGVGMYDGKLGRIWPKDYPAMFWLEKILTAGMRIFDLGGHVGTLYYAYKKYIDFPENLRWVVCDVPAVVEAGRKLADESGEDGLSFTSDFNEGDGADLFLASGSLMYIEKPVSEILSQYEKLPTHVLINSTALHNKYEFVTLQNYGAAFAPYKIMKQSTTIESVEDLGYSLADRWECAEKNCYIPFFEDHCLHSYTGLYFRQ